LKLSLNKVAMLSTRTVLAILHCWERAEVPLKAARKQWLESLGKNAGTLTNFKRKVGADITQL
jgi:hypothetical protein